MMPKRPKVIVSEVRLIPVTLPAVGTKTITFDGWLAMAFAEPMSAPCPCCGRLQSPAFPTRQALTMVGALNKLEGELT